MLGTGFRNAVALAITLTCAAGSARAQGFGLNKETAELHRKLPSAFHLEGTNVSVKVSGSLPNSQSLVQQFGPLLEIALQEADQHISIENTNAETLISCTLTGYVTPHIQVLSRPVTTVTKKGPQMTQQPYQKVTGQLTAAYKATDAKTKKTLDAAIIEVKINEDYETGGGKTKSIAENVDPRRFLSSLHGKHESEEAIPASPEDVNQLLLKRAVKRIAMRIVTTDDTVSVVLPKGALEEASRYGKSGLWPRMLEATMALPPFPHKEDEAYRQYNAGVAYEAMGYDAPDARQAMALFEKAAVEYGKALEGKPEEKYFLPPQQRIEEAMVISRTVADRKGAKTAPARPEPAATPTPVTDKSIGNAPTGKATAAPATDGDTLTNQQLIELAKGGMDEQNLIANIKEAKKVQFDFSITAQKELLQSGISNNVIAAMRARTRPAAAVRRPASAAGTPARGGTAPTNGSEDKAASTKPK